MISVVIPVFNEEETIDQCLESLVKQKEVDFEIIIIDDGSTDQTVTKIKDIQRKFPNIIMLFKKNHQGPGIARNLGAGKARGQILVFVDADMTFKDDFLNRLTLPVREKIAKGTFTRDEFVSNWDNVWARCWNYNEGKKNRMRVSEDYSQSAPVFRAILKTEFEKAGGFDPIGYTDDWSLSRKLGYQAIAASQAFCYHRNPDSLKEVFRQSRWVGKNEFLNHGYKKFINLLRYSLPVSLINSFYKSIVLGEPRFCIFKLVYDFGVFLSISRSFIDGNLYK